MTFRSVVHFLKFETAGGEAGEIGEGTYQAPTPDDPIITRAQHHRSDFPGALKETA